MLLNPNKKSVTIILEKIKPSGEGGGDRGMGASDAKRAMMEQFAGVEPEDYKPNENDEICVECAERIIDAIASKDAKMLHAALSDYMTLYEKSSEEGEMEDEQES